MHPDYTIPVFSLLISLLAGLATAAWFVIELWGQVKTLKKENEVLIKSNQELKDEVKELRIESKSFVSKVYDKLNNMAQGLVRVETKVEGIEKHLERD